MIERGAGAVRTSERAVADARARHAARVGQQLVRWSWLGRGLGEAYELRLGDEVVGHAVVGGAPGEARDEVAEFALEPGHEGSGPALLRALADASGATRMAAQTNDLTALRAMTAVTASVGVGALLFRDGGGETPGVEARRVFRRVLPGDLIFAHASEPVGVWAIEEQGEVVATGGVLTHYNAPFGDVHMEVRADARRRGVGAYLVGRLRGFCREAGLIAAARCRPDNLASRACLLRAGMVVCGAVLEGRLAWTGRGRAGAAR